jgi:hypothetical protein
MKDGKRLAYQVMETLQAFLTLIDISQWLLLSGPVLNHSSVTVF